MKMKLAIILIILIAVTIAYAANVKWSALDELTTIDDADVLCVIDSGTSKKITVINFFDTIDTFSELNTVVADKTLVNEEDAVAWDALGTFNLGITITTGDPFTLGAVQWDDGSDKINGEQIADDTIDDDSIDWTDVTGVDITLTDAGAITSSGVITATTSFIGPLFDAAGAEDMDYGSLDVLDHTFTTNDCTIILDAGITVSTGDTITLGAIVWNSSDNIDGEVIADNTIDNDSIDWADMTDLTTDGALDADVVDEAHIADDGIDSEHYNDGSIDAAHLAADIIDETKIADDGIDSEHYTAASIDNEHLADDAVDSAEIATNAVKLDALDVSDVSDNIAGDIAEGELANSIVVSADVKDGEITEADLNATNAPGAGEDNYVLTYNHAATNFTWAVDADSGGATAYDDIDDPDAASSITFADGETVTWATSEDSAGSFFLIQNSDADLAANTYLLDLDYSVDEDQANADYFKCQDAGGVVFSIQQNGDTVSNGSVTMSTFILTGADASPAAVGNVKYDSTVAGMSGGALRWYDDNSVRLLVDLETDPTDDDYVVTYDAAADGFYMSSVGTGDMTKAVYDSGDSGGVDLLTTVDSTYAGDYVLLTGTAVGTAAPKTDGALTYDATSGTLAATEFSGGGGSLTGVDAATGDSATDFFDAGALADDRVPDDITIDLATLATTVTVSDDENTDDDQEVVFTTNNANLESDGDFHYSPDTGTVTATVFSTSSNIKSEPKHLIFTLWNPNALYDDDTQICIWPLTDAAITITKIEVTCNADPGTELDFDLKWADAFIGLANAAVIDEMNTTSGTTSISAGFDDETVASGKCIYVEFQADPDAAITQASINVTFDYD